MEMQIAQLSMGMAAANLQNALSVGMLKKNLDATQQTMEAFTDMMANMPSPDGKGQLLNVLVLLPQSKNSRFGGSFFVIFFILRPCNKVLS